MAMRPVLARSPPDVSAGESPIEGNTGRRPQFSTGSRFVMSRARLVSGRDGRSADPAKLGGFAGSIFLSTRSGVTTTCWAVAAPEHESAACAVGGAGVGFGMQWLNDLFSGDKSFGFIAFLA